MRFPLLGRVEVTCEDDRAVAVATGRERVLLSTVVLGANRSDSSARLIHALRGDDPTTTAAIALQVYVSKLRDGNHLSYRAWGTASMAKDGVTV